MSALSTIKFKNNSLTDFNKKKSNLALVFIMPAMLFVGFFFLYPLVNVIIMSFQDFPLLGERSWVGLSNYTDAFQDAEFLKSIKITLLYTVLVTPLLFFTSLGMALLIVGEDRYSKFFRTIFFLPVVIGFGSASFLWYWFVDARVGPLPQFVRNLGFGKQEDQWLGAMPLALFMVILLVVWKFSAFQMILLMAAIQGIPKEIIEAAQLDGAKGFKLLRTIILPLIKRTVTMVLILSIAGSLLAFDQFYIVTNGGPNGATVTTVFHIYRQSFLQFQLGYGAALSVIVSIALISISYIQFRLLKVSDDE
jgi:multiple sugar transport system permease protein